MLKKKFVLFILVIFILSLSAVSASDLNQTDDIIESPNMSLDEISSSDVNLTAPDVSKYYSGPERLNVYLYDNDSKPLADENITILINGVNYTRTTDSNGTASIALNLNSNNYTAVITYNSISINSLVEIKETVNGSDITKIFRNETQYYATFKDAQGNYLAEGTTVSFNINGVFYERKINGTKGLARLNINLNPGTYILTATNPVTREECSNLVTVLPSIIAKDLVKYYKNDSQYIVKIIDGEGNPVGEGKNVTFNINGVLYTKQTNASGDARLNINLNPGQYIITAKYNSCEVSSLITVKSLIISEDLLMSYKDGSKFEVNLVDNKGNPISGENVTFNINGVFYNKSTDGYGIAKLNINLNKGTYVITSQFNDSIVSNNIVIKDPNPYYKKKLQILVNEVKQTLRLNNDYLDEDVIINKDITIYGNGHTISNVYLNASGYNVVLYNCTFRDCNNIGRYSAGVISAKSVNAYDCKFINTRGVEAGAILADSINAINCSFIDVVDAYNKTLNSNNTNTSGSVFISNKHNSIEIVSNKSEYHIDENIVIGFVDDDGSINITGKVYYFFCNIDEEYGDDIYEVSIIDNLASIPLFNYNVTKKIVVFSSGNANYSSANKVIIPSIVDYLDYLDELQALIDNASEGSTVYLTRDYDFNPGEITSTKNITIDGMGHTIRTHNTESNSTIIKANNLTIQNCNFEGFHGRLVYANGIVNVVNSSFVNFEALYTTEYRNTVGYCGAAIYNPDGTVNIVNSIFENCSSNYGGAVYANDVNVLNSNFTSCAAKVACWQDGSFGVCRGWGGAIYAKNSTCVDNSSFINNTADQYGAIYTPNLKTNNTIYLNNTPYATKYYPRIIIIDMDLY